MNTNRDLGLKTVRIEKNDLLDKIKENRDKHSSDFQESLRSYHEQLLKTMKDKMDEISDCTWMNILEVDMSFKLIKPVSHTSDYNTVIKMLEWSIDEFIDLHQDEFKKYVLDEWSWSNQFDLVKSTYMASAPRPN